MNIDLLIDTRSRIDRLILFEGGCNMTATKCKYTKKDLVNFFENEIENDVKNYVLDLLEIDFAKPDDTAESLAEDIIDRDDMYSECFIEYFELKRSKSGVFNLSKLELQDVKNWIGEHPDLYYEYTLDNDFSWDSLDVPTLIQAANNYEVAENFLNFFGLNEFSKTYTENARYFDESLVKTFFEETI